MATLNHPVCVFSSFKDLKLPCILGETSDVLSRKSFIESCKDAKMSQAGCFFCSGLTYGSDSMLPIA